MRIWELIYGGGLDILFPQKCVFCGKLLDGEPDICGKCRGAMEKFPELPPNTKPDGKSRLQFLDSFTAVWYYKGKVRDGILGLKFRYRVDYALPLGRSVAMISNRGRASMRSPGRRSAPCADSAGATTNLSCWPGPWAKSWAFRCGVC